MSWFYISHVLNLLDKPINNITTAIIPIISTVKKDIIPKKDNITSPNINITTTPIGLPINPIMAIVKDIPKVHTACSGKVKKLNNLSPPRFINAFSLISCGLAVERIVSIAVPVYPVALQS